MIEPKASLEPTLKSNKAKSKKKRRFTMMSLKNYNCVSGMGIGFRANGFQVLLNLPRSSELAQDPYAKRYDRYNPLVWLKSNMAVAFTFSVHAHLRNYPVTF